MTDGGADTTCDDNDTTWVRRLVKAEAIRRRRERVRQRQYCASFRLEARRRQGVYTPPIAELIDTSSYVRVSLFVLFPRLRFTFFSRDTFMGTWSNAPWLPGCSRTACVSARQNVANCFEENYDYWHRQQSKDVVPPNLL